MPSLTEAISQLIGIPVDDVLRLANMAPTRYKMYYIPKKQGGRRRIHHPSKETKMLQYAVYESLLHKLPLHGSAVGFIRGLKSPLRSNATKHCKNPYLLRIDFEDFFPSIRPKDLFLKIPIGLKIDDICITDTDHDFLKKSLFVNCRSNLLELAVGAPTSPCTSNIVMRYLDEEFSNVAKRYEAVYTRYADDMIFSTQNRNSSSQLLEEIRSIIEACDSPNLNLNEKKTQYMSKNCRRAVTGLIITPDGSISIGRAKKRKLRSLLYSSKEGSISEDDASYLQGYLAFLLDVEPAYYNNLVFKYGAYEVQAALKRADPA